MSKSTYQKSMGGFVFGSSQELSDKACNELISSFHKKSQGTSQLLNGRGNVIFTKHSGLGDIVIKRYLRGGLFRFLVQSKYLRWGISRGEHEYRLLEKAREVGVNTPEPLVFASSGTLLYDAWLVTREIAGRINFADYARANEDKALQFVPEIVRQITVLINNRIFHVDLHPGNVVVDNKEALFLLDFDKASIFEGTKNKLRDLYLLRWRRAVIKHGLPESLSETICPGLRINFEG